MKGKIANFWNIVCAGTEKLRLPRGTTAERPASPVNGDIRYNTTTNRVEAFENGEWKEVIVTAVNCLAPATQDENSGTRKAVTSSATANTFGSWVELIGSTAFEAQQVVFSFSPVDVTINQYRCQLGIGAAAAEVVITQGVGMQDAGDYATGFSTFLGRRIPAGSRLAARVEDNINFARDYQASVTLHGE